MARLPNLQVLSGLLSSIGNDLVLDCLTFIESTEAGPLHGGNVNKYVTAPVLRLDEPNVPISKYLFHRMVCETITPAPGRPPVSNLRFGFTERTQLFFVALSRGLVRCGLLARIGRTRFLRIVQMAQGKG